MENNLVSMAREIERLRAELSNPDIRSWGPDGSHRANIGTYDSTFLHPYGNAYGRNMGAAENGPFCGPGSTSWAEVEKSQMTGQ
ncbi:protein FLX-like 3 [Bidens hawaiensis]|uniref:protein FLX-like 3 n=1 Tax=Bidens hawaiensis TaxID=980011 RepID=UPI004049AC8C